MSKSIAEKMIDEVLLEKAIGSDSKINIDEVTRYPWTSREDLVDRLTGMRFRENESGYYEKKYTNPIAFSNDLQEIVPKSFVVKRSLVAYKNKNLSLSLPVVGFEDMFINLSFGKDGIVIEVVGDFSEVATGEE